MKTIKAIIRKIQAFWDVHPILYRFFVVLLRVLYCFLFACFIVYGYTEFINAGYSNELILFALVFVGISFIDFFCLIDDGEYDYKFNSINYDIERIHQDIDLLYYLTSKLYDDSNSDN